MADNLSHSKRKFIERWRKSVDHYMVKGNLCKVTITDVPPEDEDRVFSPASERSRSVASLCPPAESSSHFPVISNGYSHVGYDMKSRKTRNGEKIRLRLPPSPNGMLVHRAPGIHSPWFLMNLQKPENKDERLDVANLKGIGTKSSQVAKEIFDKYNMKSDSQNMLPGKHIYNGFQQLSMPWRNKTFLTLPVRLNGTIRMKNTKYLDSDQLTISSGNADFGSDVTVMSTEYRSGFGDCVGGE